MFYGVSRSFCSVRSIQSGQKRWYCPGLLPVSTISLFRITALRCGLLELVGFLQYHVLDLYGGHLLGSANISHLVPFVNGSPPLFSQVVPSFHSYSQHRNGKYPVKPGSPIPKLPGFLAHANSLSIPSNLAISFFLVSFKR